MADVPKNHPLDDAGIWAEQIKALARALYNHLGDGGDEISQTIINVIDEKAQAIEKAIDAVVLERGSA